MIYIVVYCHGIVLALHGNGNDIILVFHGHGDDIILALHGHGIDTNPECSVLFICSW